MIFQQTINPSFVPVISSSLVALINNEDIDNDGGCSGHKANGNISRELNAIISTIGKKEEK